jgi:hypothetical protein
MMIAFMAPSALCAASKRVARASKRLPHVHSWNDHSIKKSRRASNDALRAATIHSLNSDYPLCEFVGASFMPYRDACAQ